MFNWLRRLFAPKRRVCGNAGLSGVFIVTDGTLAVYCDNDKGVVNMVVGKGIVLPIKPHLICDELTCCKYVILREAI